MPTNLKQARLDAGFTKADFADALGVRPDTVSGWESGTKYPTFNRLKRICDILNNPNPFWLFEMSERALMLSAADIQKLRSTLSPEYWIKTLGGSVRQYKAAAILGVSPGKVKEMINAGMLLRSTSGGVDTVSVLAYWALTPAKTEKEVNKNES